MADEWVSRPYSKCLDVFKCQILNIPKYYVPKTRTIYLFGVEEEDVAEEKELGIVYRHLRVGVVDRPEPDL